MLKPLIVDDSPLMRAFIKRVITMAGYESAPLEAGNGREALECLKSNRADVILTDINMPVMSGEEFLVELKKNGTLATIPTLVISTDATRDRAHRMLELGARGYLAKPFSPEALREELEKVLGDAHAI
jgi:two-component system, chemotaxis family, chemotaxis protein CheY